MAEFAHFILEKFAKRFNQREIHFFPGAADIVMAFDYCRRPLERDALDYIRIECPLSQKFGIGILFCFFFKNGNKLVPDNLAFAFGIGNALQPVEKPLARIHKIEVHMEMITERLLYLLGLTLAQ